MDDLSALVTATHVGDLGLVLYFNWHWPATYLASWAFKE